MIHKIFFSVSLIFLFQPLFSQTVIRMEKINGVYQIPCKINGIEMKFILDTGASDVSISKTEANFLAKQGLITEDDIIGKQQYLLADGSIAEGTKIRIKEIQISDLFIRDISVTVIDNANAPLLFGQSAISKFGRFEIDGNILRIYPKEEKNIYEFLNIDLTKSIEDFGFSRSNLVNAKPVIGIPFEVLNISKNHELEELEFDKQSVVFDDTGNIFMVGLTKKFNNLNDEIKREESRKFYNLLYEKISNLYGTADNKMSGISKWDKKNFEININIQSDYEVGLFYMPKILIKNERLPELSKEQIDNTENEIKTLRSELAVSVNEAVSTRFDNLNASAHTKNSILIFSFNYKIEEENIIIDEFVDFISYAVLDYILNSENAYNALQLFLGIQFDFNITNPDNKKLKINRFLSKEDYHQLKYPLNEERFMKRLKKYNG
jgi:clan AA aspartic protease (TIGR02281 family)